MEKKDFSPETDFEKQNLDVIENLRKIQDEDLSAGFEKKLYERILSEQEFLWKGESKNSKITEFIKSIFLPNKALAYLAYASLLICFFITGYYIALWHGKTVNTNAVMASRVEDSIKSPNTVETAQQENAVVKKQNNSGKEKYLKEFHQKVLMNVNYGFLNNPSYKEIIKLLDSDKFKQHINEYSNPTLDDSVKTVINILEEQE